MAVNQHVNKVVFGSATLVDLTGTTATADKILQGYGAYGADGAWMDGTATSSGTAAISVVDTTDSHGGTIRTITGLDISDTTAVASDVATGKYFYTANGTKTAGTASGGGTPLATQHTIHLEFSDSTDTDINVYYDDALIGSMITSYEPTNWYYSNKTVYVAELDGVEWYDAAPSPVTWETLWDNANTPFYEENNGDYPYCWISELSQYEVAVGDMYRITYGNSTHIVTGALANGDVVLGNPKYYMGADDGSGVPFVFSWSRYGAWTGSIDAPNQNGTYYIKIEREATS